MSRCDVHCPTPTRPWWLLLLATAAAAAYGLWRAAGWLADHLGRAIPSTIAAAVAVVVVGAIALLIHDAVRTTPAREKRLRYSELPAPVVETPAPVVELEPVTYPPLRAVPNLDEERAA